MTQKINLNASPYYDDFDSEKDFHKVLYKPGFPVQARELTSQQSILQNQIESFGDHVFKDGSVVIPGGIAFDNQYNAVKLNSTNFNIDISVYINNYLGKKIIGSESGIEAVVKFISLPDGKEIEDVTLYVTYLSANKNSEFSTFIDGESLSSDEIVIYGNTTISPNTPFASLISSDATATGSAAFISKGVYFIRGFFVNVSKQTIILDPYTNNSSYRVGLQINELIVNAKEDNTLYDNAKGFTNFAAPGADRLKIELILTKKLLTDKNDTDFVELMRIDNGKIKVMQAKSEYNKIRDWIAERTYEESGDYSVDPFKMGLFNSLNNNLGNNGLFLSGDTTDQGNEPSDDLMCLKLSSGQAYVRGYDIEKTGTTIIDVEKPRDVGIRSDVGIGYEMGNILFLNNVTKGRAVQNGIVKLFDNFNSTGTNIGSARVYSFNLEDSEYVNATTSWELRLFDIQTNTDLIVNLPVNSTEIPKGAFIKGKNSGATGFHVNNITTTTQIISVNETKGTFSVGEQIEVNGVDFPRTIGVSTVYTTQSIKSVEDGIKFKGDVVCDKFRLPENVTDVVISNSGATATAVNGSFSRLRPGAILLFNEPGGDTTTYNEVTTVDPGGKAVGLAAVPGVTGIRKGTLFTAGGTVQMFAAAPIVRGTGALYAPLDQSNIASVDLTQSQIKIVKQLDSKAASSNRITVNTSDITDESNIIFNSFDQERYSAFDNASGAPIALSNNRFQYNSGGEQIVFNNVSAGNYDLNVSLTKSKIKSKIKNYNRSQKLNVTRSKYAKSGSVAAGNGGAVSDGLIFDKRYGLRVQDEEISLNYPDVVKFLAVYESTTTDGNPAVFDQLVFPGSVNVDSSVITGENLIGDDSRVIARVVSKPASNTLEIVYLSSGKFISGDEVTFQESNVKSNIESITIGKYKNLTNSFQLDKGQRDEFYDYSRLIRNKNVPEPKGQLTVVFDYYEVAADDGDVFTVASYDSDRFSKDIPSIGNLEIRATDTFDFRPRVSVYNPSTNTESPFQFNERSFDSQGTFRFLESNENSIASYEHYLGRIDKVYLNKFGDFVYEKGISSIDPRPPVKTGELMDLATITLPPYLYNTQNASITFNDNRRFTMRDIGNIEDRVSSLEEVTTLSLLEASAQTLQILDEEGRNKFKSGFFVDPFKNYDFINRNASLIQINPAAEELIPFRSRDTLASQITPSPSVDISQLDFDTDFDLFDPNIKKTGDLITLNYEEVEWITQPYATKTGDINDIMNVNPYEIPVFSGNIELDPRSDVWTRTVQLPDQTVRQQGSNGTSSDVSLDINLGSADNPATFDRGIRRVANPGKAGTTVQKTIFQGEVSQSDVIDQTISLSNVDTTIQNELQSSGSDDFMRSRNIQFVSNSFANHLRLYLYLDGQRITDILPKLLEIVKQPNGTEVGSNGTFSIGETVEAFDGSTLIAKFRLCKPDHKFGAFSEPSEVYLNNPYTKETGLVRIPPSYSPSLSVLNIDTKSLSEEAQGDFYGYLVRNAKLVGKTSNATAYVKDLRLVTDDFGDLIGSCFLRDPYAQPTPTIRIPAGSKTFKLTSSATNENLAPAEKFGVVAAETRYDAFGTVEEWERTLTIETNTNTVNISGDLTGNIALTETVQYYDPLAQTFVVGGNVDAPSAVTNNNDLNGVFITAVEVYFASVDTITNSPITCEIRSTVADARPSRTLLGRSKTLRPRGVDADGNEVTLIEFDAESASKPTKFTFPEPIYLAPGLTYSFVLVAPQSTAYNVWTGKQGGAAVNANTIQEADSGASLIYSTQYAMGAIFKSQNGALWTEDQTQDITFKLYKAKFTSQSGSAYFNNPKLSDSNGYVPVLLDNPIETFPKTGKIGITTQTSGALTNKLIPGRKISVYYPTTTAVITGTGSSVTFCSPMDGGTNYTNTNDVETFAITGKGSGLKVNITTTGGAITGIAGTVQGGNGYQLGDIVGIVTSTVGSQGGQGTGALISIGNTAGIDTLFLTDIQGGTSTFNPLAGTGVTYFDDGDTTTPTGTFSNEITTRVFDGGVNSGNVMKVNHFNHGMYSYTNKVSIEQIESDVEPSTLSAELSRTETSTISVASTSQFENFEGIPVSATNIGYVRVGNEIIGYQGVTDDALLIGSGTNKQRGVDNTILTDHQLNSVIRKHEISGVSIRRIEITNKDISSLSPIGLDDYHITFDRTAASGKDRSSDAAGAPELSFNSQSLVGGSNVKASQNILYGALVPRYDVLTPTGIDGSTTSVDASIRTVSGTSVDGNEISFVDDGFQPVQLNRINSFDSVKVVASKINEDLYLSNLPSNKSFTTLINFNSNDENISPVIRLSSGSETEFISHRLNQPIDLESYATDNRVDSILSDPHAASYVSNTIRLSKPASSLKILLSAFRPESSDFRVLYSLATVDSGEVSQAFDLFPGFKNQTTASGNVTFGGDSFIVTNPANNDGRPDTIVTPSGEGEFKDYQFTADDLPQFTGFTIKIVMSGTNQARPPRITQLRAIAVA